MKEAVRFPVYIHREEEQQIRHEAALVKEAHKSRVVALYGAGGVGKTWLVRELTKTGRTDKNVIWIEPMDIDDSEYWLLSNLEQKIADQLDPGNRYFNEYREYLSNLPRYTRPRTGLETVVTRLGRIKAVFLECYKRFIEETARTVVIPLDTVEAIRGTYLLLTLTRWIKALPGTLFILSGRPTHADTHDPIRRELESGQNPLPVIRIDLAGFSEEAALGYLNASGAARDLTLEEKEKVVHLTRGHPLWLAFALDYLMDVGLPKEAEESLADITAVIPFEEGMTTRGQALHDAFKRRLVTPYRGADFWQEAIKRLAVVRQRVNQLMWQELMSDLKLPDGVENWDEAWHVLLDIPWIRPRANRRYVTLHDAVAEELALRIIPVHDQDKGWRRSLWRQAMEICRELTESSSTELNRRLEQILSMNIAFHGPDRASLVLEEIVALDGKKREIDQLKASQFYYQLLSDPAEGYREFLALLEQTSKQHDILFQQLIALEMQRFLRSGEQTRETGDITYGAIESFQTWLRSHPDLYLEIGLKMAEYLIGNEQADSAIELLDRPWPLRLADPVQRYRLSTLRGNACLRTPGRVKEGENHFRQALDAATALDSDDRHNFVAKAYKELGFYYRSVGLWGKADESYAQAHREISTMLSNRSPTEDREEMASIQTNWAYVKGLRGSHREGHNLVESAIAVRSRFGRIHEVGISWSVYGEIHRYNGQFKTAWDAYREAEDIFQSLKSMSWLGLIYQEQAICLHQAAQAGLDLLQEEKRDSHRQEEKWDPDRRAEFLIRLALDICREHGVRGYPSALNRAGRIFAQKDSEIALSYLEVAIAQARQLSDGWFWFASLIEYVELNYRVWIEKRQSEYRKHIDRRAPEIEQIMREYEFPDLRGRWELLQGHLYVRDALASKEESGLIEALKHYKDGFLQLARGYVASHGSGSVSAEFARFRELFERLPDHVKEVWLDELRPAWHEDTSLLALMEQLY